MTTSEPYDLVGGPFAVIESDPGVFTALIQKLGVKGLEVIELYDIEPWAVDHLNPHGLIFCYMCTEESDNFETGDELDDPDAERVWFANQLSDDACSSQAILNVLLNRPHIYISDELSDFKKITEDMSPVMRGLALSGSHFIRAAQNSLARPADIRGGMHAVAATTIEANKHDVGRTSDGSPAKKKRKTSRTTAKSKQKAAQSVLDSQEAYHFIGYVPARDKVWELDGLRSCALEVGTLPPECRSEDGRNGWMDIVRPALRMKMQKYTSGSDHIRYSLLAIVDDRYQKASDELELLKRERHALERRLNNVHPEGWSHKVDADLVSSASESFATSMRSPREGRVYSEDFGSRKMDKEIAILDMPVRNLPSAWEACVKAAIPAKIAAEDEIAKSRDAHTDHIKRTFDYEPFITEFVTCMHNEGRLDAALRGNSVDEGTAQVKPKPKGRK